MKKPTQKNHQTSNPEKLSNHQNLQPRKIIKPWNLQPKKSSNPHEKTKPRNLKQINTHKEKTNPGQRESDLIGSFPHSLSNQTHKKKKKIIISFNFVTLYQTRSVTHMPRPSNGARMQWFWACTMEAMEAMHVSIYFECYDVHDNMKKVRKEFMNSIMKNKMGF